MPNTTPHVGLTDEERQQLHDAERGYLLPCIENIWAPIVRRLDTQLRAAIAEKEALEKARVVTIPERIDYHNASTARCDVLNAPCVCGSWHTPEDMLERLWDAYQAPLDMILHCPGCGMQHVDKPRPEKGWTNPPHKTHECQGCGSLWRPAMHPTNGVESIGHQEECRLMPLAVLLKSEKTKFRQYVDALYDVVKDIPSCGYPDKWNEVRWRVAKAIKQKEAAEQRAREAEWKLKNRDRAILIALGEFSALGFTIRTCTAEDIEHIPTPKPQTCATCDTLVHHRPMKHAGQEMERVGENTLKHQDDDTPADSTPNQGRFQREKEACPGCGWAGRWAYAKYAGYFHHDNPQIPGQMNFCPGKPAPAEPERPTYKNSHAEYAKKLEAAGQPAADIQAAVESANFYATHRTFPACENMARALLHSVEQVRVLREALSGWLVTEMRRNDGNNPYTAGLVARTREALARTEDGR